MQGKPQNRRIIIVAFGLLVFSVALLFAVFEHASQPALAKTVSSSRTVLPNPLRGRKFYIDNSRLITQLATSYKNQNDPANASLAQKISSQPGTVWLTGPTSSDPSATKDIQTVQRTSAEALAQHTIPIYELYALPQRDACASFSKGGFATSQEYMTWLNSILASLQTDAVFSVEADGVAQTIQTKCLSIQQTQDRYALLNSALTRLRNAPHVLASYLDAGNSEWFPNPKQLVGALRKSGVGQARGVALNVSYFVSTDTTIAWSYYLLGILGGNKTAIIDTSRSGQGAAPKDVTGDARWCNPTNRGLGHIPTTATGDSTTDAFFWGKIIGESDGDCRGYPPAGTFVPALALDLARHAKS